MFTEFSSVLCCLIVAFNMYDLDGDSMISREELLSVLHMMVGANISEEQVSRGVLEGCLSHIAQHSRALRGNSSVTFYNAFFWEIDTHPPRRNANNIEPYTFVTLFSGTVVTLITLNRTPS